jgi:DNA mismatch repair protein MutS2
VRELREGEITKEKTKEVKSFINELHQEEEKLEAKVENLNPQSQEDAQVFKPDDPVYVGKSKKDGVVIRAMNKGKYLVAVGQMRLVLDSSELSPGKVQKESGSIRKSVMASYRKPVLELDIRGYRLDEAIRAMESQMDSALLCGLSEFSVIHGTGEGILQKGVRDYLSSNRNVKSYSFARPEEGGFGKTIVKLVE